MQPNQPTKAAPSAGVAVSVTLLPFAAASEQSPVDPVVQRIPGPSTVPTPETRTVRSYVAGWNVAVTVFAMVIDEMVQVVPETLDTAANSIALLAQNQLQAMQMSLFYMLPSILLSGFAFPFRGMPGWAQAIGECLPLTHFLRIVRGILLKGSGPAEIAPELWPLLLFLAVAMAVGVKRYRQTLD